MVRHHGASDTRRQYMRGTDRQSIHFSGANGRHGNEFGGRARGIGQMRFADFLADRHHDPFPADHRAQAQRDGNGDFHPRRNELGGVARACQDQQPTDPERRRLIALRFFVECRNLDGCFEYGQQQISCTETDEG